MPSAATQMDLEMIVNEVGQTETISYSITSIWSLKYDTNEPILKTETDSLTQRSEWWLPRGVQWEGQTENLGLAERMLHLGDFPDGSSSKETVIQETLV